MKCYDLRVSESATSLIAQGLATKDASENEWCNLQHLGWKLMTVTIVTAVNASNPNKASNYRVTRDIDIRAVVHMFSQPDIWLPGQGMQAQGDILWYTTDTI